MMIRNYLPQIALDASFEIAVCTASTTERHVGAEVAALPQVLATVIDGMLLG